jgi:hypothetical protein
LNKKQAERIATIGLAVFLVGMFIYQVAHADKVNCGDTLCNGQGMTNEGSYHYGYNNAKGLYECNKDPDASCKDGGDLCSSEIQVSVHNITSGYFPSVDLGHVSNQTACIDGYVNGWNKACMENGKIAREQHLTCPTDFMNEVDKGLVNSYDAGVRHLFVTYWETHKPSAYQIKQGFWSDDVLLPALMDKTWNIANETSGMTMMPMDMMNTTAQSGTIIFNADHFTGHINSNTVQGTWSTSLSCCPKKETTYAQGISLVFLTPDSHLVTTANLYFKDGDMKNHIQFTDDHNDTIYLIRNG